MDQSVIDSFKNESARLLNDNCDGILIACTELSLLRQYLPTDVVCVDSLDSLTKKIVSLCVNVEPKTFRDH